MYCQVDGRALTRLYNSNNNNNNQSSRQSGLCACAAIQLRLECQCEMVFSVFIRIDENCTYLACITNLHVTVGRVATWRVCFIQTTLLKFTAHTCQCSASFTSFTITTLAGRLLKLIFVVVAFRSFIVFRLLRLVLLQSGVQCTHLSSHHRLTSSF